MIVPINMTADNMTFICKHFYVLSITNEINLDCNLSSQGDKNIYTFINNETKNQIIKEQNLHLYKHKINSTNNVQDLTVMYWIPKMHKNSISFIIAFPSM